MKKLIADTVRPTPVFQRGALALLVIWALLMFVGGQTKAAVGLFTTPWDKLAHLSSYAAAASLCWVALGGRRPWLVLGGMISLGALDEMLQRLNPGRQVDLGDLAVDVIGATLAVVILSLLADRFGRDRPDASPRQDAQQLRDRF